MKSKHLLLMLLLALMVPWVANAQSVTYPTWSSGTNSYIKEFKVVDGGNTLIDNVTTGTAAQATDYFDDATLSINAQAGNELTFTISTYNSGTHGFGLWADLDGDGLETTDCIFGTSTYASTPCNITFTIPSNTPAGEYRVRIVAAYSTGSCSNPNGSYSNGESEDYKLVVTVPAFPKPANVRTGIITGETAEVFWDAPESVNTISGYTFNYKKSDEEFWSSEGSATTTSANIEGLEPNTQYDFRVKACYNNNSGESGYATRAFTTDCQAEPALGYDEYFDDITAGNNVLPDCWHYINTTTYSYFTSYPRVYNSNSYSASNCLFLYSYAYYNSSGITSSDPQPQYAILPNMEGLAGMQVTLQAKGHNTNSTFKVGTMSDFADASTFHLITEQTGLTTSYQEFQFDVPATCTDKHFCIMIDGASQTRTTNGVYIDDIVIATPPTCIKPTDLDVTAYGLSATVTWESTESQWQVAYSTDATADPNANIVATVNTNAYSAINLTVDSDYYFWVRSYCSDSDQSDWVGTASVHIGYCVPAPVSVDGSGITNVTFGTGDVQVNNDTHPSSQPYYGNYSTQIGAVQAGVESTVSITYSTGEYGYYHNYGTIIWVDFDNSFSFEDSEIIFAGQSSTLTYPGVHTLNATFTLPDTQAIGDFRMRIGGADSYFDSFIGGTATADHDPCYSGNFTIFEDYTLRVLEAPSCPVPTYLNLSLDYNQITATWEGIADTYNIDINGTVTNNVTIPYSFTAEQLSTTYTVKVQANCEGDETSNWSDPKSITTPTNCWGEHIIEYTLTDSYGDGWSGTSISAILVYEGCGNLVETLTIPSGYSLSGTLDLCADYYEFVWQAGQYPEECSFTFTEGGTTLFTKPSSATNGMVLYTIGTQSCPTPTTLTAGTAEARSVALTWNENGEATAWQICLNGDEENLIEVVENFTNNEGVVSYILTGLTPENDYTIKVRANCGEEQSCWSGEESFSTIEACPVPTTLDVSEETLQKEMAILTWVADDTGTAWNIQLSTYDDANETWSEYVVIAENFDGTTYTIENLTAGTAYRVQVQAVCGGGFNDMSEWSDYFEFTTIATCETPTNLAVTPDSETAFGATLTWEGTSDSYTLEYSKAIAPEVFDETYDFEDGAQGWTTIDADGHGNAWSRYNSSSYAHQGYYSMKATFNGSYAHQDYLVSPQIPLGGSFSFYLKKSGSYYDTFRVYLSTTGNTNASDFSIELTNGNVLPGNSYGDTPYTYDLSNYSGMGYVAIVYTAAANQGWLYVDDVNVTGFIEGEYGAWQSVENATTPYTFDELDPESMYKVRVKGVCGSSVSQYSNTVKFTTPEACPAPTDFTLGAVTESSAAFGWTQPAYGVEINAWIVKYRKSGETEWQTLTSYPTTLSATIENLDANTGYEVLIAPECNEEKTLEGEFDTPCAVKVITLGSPFTYDYESIDEWNCWTNVAGDNVRSSGNNNTTGGNYKLQFKGTTTGNIVALPEFNHEISELMIVFRTRPESYDYSSCGTFEVGYMTDLADATSFVSVLNEPYSYNDWASNTYAKKTAVFTGAPDGAHIAFRHNALAYNYYWYVDDVMVGLLQNFSKEIAGYGEGNEDNKANWYFIASPIGDINPTEVTNMTEGTFDLYYFNQSQNHNEWINYEGANGGYGLYNGKGYLYANQENTTITFTGIANHANATVNLSKYTAAVWSGWNLVGNPFGVTAYIDRDFYRINEETGAEIIQGSGAINVMEGVFVVTDEDNVEMTFSTEPVNADKGSLALNLSNNNNVIDRAMVRFNDERTLPKFQLFENSTKLYIPMDGKDYAVVSSEGVGEMPVSFKAEKNGSYTLSFTSQEVSFSYLHLIDNMTGNNVDLLKTPSYTFDATTTDYAQRFRLVFATGSSVNNDNFGFVNAMGNLCIFGIEGEATLQVIDITGRVISSNQFSGSYESKFNVAPGVYMLRLINGNDVKVQKIVME